MVLWFGCDESCELPSDASHFESSNAVASGMRHGEAETVDWVQCFDAFASFLGRAEQNTTSVLGAGAMTPVRAFDCEASDCYTSPLVSGKRSSSECSSSPLSEEVSDEEDGSDVEWHGSDTSMDDADADEMHQEGATSPVGILSEGSTVAPSTKGTPPRLYGAAARASQLEKQSGPAEQVMVNTNDIANRRSHPSFEEWRAEKLAECSLKEVFFGLGHSCTNLWNGKACHVNLWGDVETGLQALKSQRKTSHLCVSVCESSSCWEREQSICVLPFTQSHTLLSHTRLLQVSGCCLNAKRGRRDES